MKARQILILESNKKTKSNYKKMFLDTHFDVNFTSSAAYTIAHVIKGNKPIIIIGDEFEENISAHQVIALLKRVDKNLKIILVSDNSSLETLKKIREDGIFYHSLQPKTTQDSEELLTVLEFAEQKG